MEKGDEERRRGDFCLSHDLIVEILKRLPTKSLVRFRSVSKQWSTIIGSRRYFIDSIVARSLRHPPQKLPVFIFHHSVPETFFTVSPVFSQSTKHAVKIPGSSHPFSFEYHYARGLICRSSSESHLVTIYNPTTRQLIPLPEIEAPVGPSVRSYSNFGYDPVMNQYEVLSTIIDWNHDRKQTYHVFTLGQRQSWRKIKGFDEILMPSVNTVCIDGTIYYSATRRAGKRETVLLSFDIRSERFDHVWVPETLSEALSALRGHRTLVNYLGKLGCICCNSSDTSIWIMDNAEKQEWSRTILCLPKDPLSFLGTGYVDGFSGATSTGEIFATQRLYSFNKSMYVYYYDVNQNSFRRVQIEGDTNMHTYCIRVYAIHDHVENTMWL